MGKDWQSLPLKPRPALMVPGQVIDLVDTARSITLTPHIRGGKEISPSPAKKFWCIHPFVPDGRPARLRQVNAGAAFCRAAAGDDGR